MGTPLNQTYRHAYLKYSRSWTGSWVTDGFISMTLRKSAMMKDPDLLDNMMAAGLKKSVPVTNRKLLEIGKQIREKANARAPKDTGNLVESGVVVTAHPKYRDFEELPAVRVLQGHDRMRERYNRTNEVDNSYAAIRKSINRENRSIGAGGIKVRAGMRVSYAAEYALLIHENAGKPPLRDGASSHFLQMAVADLNYAAIMDVLASTSRAPFLRGVKSKVGKV